jgi:molybdate transport system substrate-binding protein
MKKPKYNRLVILAAGLMIGLIIILSIASYSNTKSKVLLYVDRTLQLPVENLFTMFKEEYGYTDLEVIYVYGSSGYVLSQLELYGYGDIYISDGGHFLEEGINKGLIIEDSIYYIGYLTISLIVEEGNPKNIRGVYDALIRKDIVLAIGNPEHVVAGIIAREILSEAGLWGLVESGVKEGHIVYAKSAYVAASYVKLGVADATITFSVFEYMDPNNLDIVYDSLLEKYAGEVVIALTKSYSEVGEEFYSYILAHLDEFYKYGVKPINEQ